MAINIENYNAIRKELDAKNVQLVAVSKVKPIEDILALYDLGQRDFGENYVQELVDKNANITNKSINWHFIGHLQTNKVKYIANFVHLIHSVDSLKLLQEINKQGKKSNRVINCLLQVFIATEETKYGLSENELIDILNEVNFGNLPNISIKGLMGMASFTDDLARVRQEFQNLYKIKSKYPQLQILSMGMSQDYKIGKEEGSNMVRIGSLLFGERNSK
jgi:pyridoxal phosphate enzyme (YggS family)